MTNEKKPDAKPLKVEPSKESVKNLTEIPASEGKTEIKQESKTANLDEGALKAKLEQALLENLELNNKLADKCIKIQDLEADIARMSVPTDGPTHIFEGAVQIHGYLSGIPVFDITDTREGEPSLQTYLAEEQLVGKVVKLAILVLPEA